MEVGLIVPIGFVPSELLQQLLGVISTKMTLLTKEPESIFLSEGFFLAARSLASLCDYASLSRFALVGTARIKTYANMSCQDRNWAIRWPFSGNLH